MVVPGAVVMVGCAVAGASSPMMWLCDGDGGVAVASAGSMAR